MSGVVPSSVAARLKMLAPMLKEAAEKENTESLYRLITVAVPHLSRRRTWTEDIQVEKIEAWELEALTPKENAVMRGIASGMTNAQIAKKLNVTNRTVETHVKGILEKLGLSNRTQVAAYYYQKIQRWDKSRE